MKSSKRLVAGILVGAMMVATISGCGKKESEEETKSYDELVAENDYYYNLVVSKDNDLKNTKEILAQYDPSLIEEDLSSVVTLDTGESAYPSILDKIRLNSDFGFESDYIEAEPNTSKIYVSINQNDNSDTVSVSPGDDWTFKIENGKLLMLHDEGLHVTIESKYYYMNNKTLNDLNAEYFKPMWDAIYTKTPYTSRAIFDSSNNRVGYMGSGQINIKNYVDGTKKVAKNEYDPVYVTDENGYQILDEYGHPEEYELDNNGDIVEDSEGNKKIAEPVEPEYEVDAFGNPVYETDENGDYVMLTDAEGNVVYETDADGNPVQMVDAEGNLVWATDENGEVIVDKKKKPTTPVYQPKYKQKEKEPTPEPEYTMETLTYYQGFITNGNRIAIIKAHYVNDGVSDAMQENLFKTVVSSIRLGNNTYTME